MKHFKQKPPKRSLSTWSLSIGSIGLLLTLAGCFKMSAIGDEFASYSVGIGHDGNSPPSSNNPTGTTLPTGPETVSAFMGTNISGDLPFNDISRVINAFDTAASDKDSRGYPQAGFNGTSSTDWGFLAWTGDYKVSYVGNGTLTFGGIASQVGSWQTVGNEQRGIVHITATPEQFGHSLIVSITNAPGQTVTDVHIFLPGVDYDTTEYFTATYLKMLKPFRQMRFMDVMGTNGSSVANWSDANISNLPFASNFSYDMMVALINETGKDAWINIPHLATENYISTLGTYLLTNLDMNQINVLRAQQGYTTPFKIYVEYSNEAWAPGSAVFNHEQDIATSNPSRYDGAPSNGWTADWINSNRQIALAAQVEADRLVAATLSLRAQFAAVGLPGCIQPVLGGWAIGATYSAIGLDFIQKNYPGPVSNYVSYVALAPYFGVLDEGMTNSLSRLFLSIGHGATHYDPTVKPPNPPKLIYDDGIASAMATLPDFAKLATSYGVKIAAYEGGQGLGGTNNTHVKRLAQVDARMYKAYKAYYAIWTSVMGPNAPFNHFSLAGGQGMPEFIGQYGFWDSVGSTQFDVSVCGAGFPTLVGDEDWEANKNFCPKWQAISEE